MRGPILKLLSATGYASVAGYGGMLILVRLYPETSFGLYDFVISIVGILTPFVSLRYEDTLMLADNDRDSAHSFLLALGLTLGLSLGLYLLLPFGDVFAAFFGDESIATWLWIIPPILIVIRYARISELWLSRSEQFGRVSRGQMTYTTTMTGIKIGGGFISTSPAGLLFGFLIGWVSAILVNLRRVIEGVSRALAEGVSLKKLKYLAIRYRRFPFFTMPASFVSMLSLRLPFLVLAYFFSLETVGYFGRAFNVLFVPLSLIVMMSWAVFWINPKHLAPQIGIATSAVFTLIAFQFSLGYTLPRISYLTQADVFVMGSMTLVFLAFGEAVLTGRLADKERLTLAQRIDRQARWLFPLAFVAVISWSFLA